MPPQIAAIRRYLEKASRSAVAPEIMVTEVAAKRDWKMRKLTGKPTDISGAKRSVPIKPLEVAPNASPYPMSQKKKVTKIKSAKFFAATLTWFL
ncbi:hypothetical protein TUMSATVNIG3_45740 [Vibrio nigripulchritudo]|nr:hypothetical protein TUMSATVNIG2_45210 [Vibrio nigripulchritudo]BDU45776.1 hypothetical protein TUMSATVNIG3_45740 [Vibrio nigripulchritudo]